MLMRVERRAPWRRLGALICVVSAGVVGGLLCAGAAWLADWLGVAP